MLNMCNQTKFIGNTSNWFSATVRCGQCAWGHRQQLANLKMLPVHSCLEPTQHTVVDSAHHWWCVIVKSLTQYNKDMWVWERQDDIGGVKTVPQRPGRSVVGRVVASSRWKTVVCRITHINNQLHINYVTDSAALVIKA